MTNTQSMPVLSQLTDEQKSAYRADEVGFLTDLGEVISRFNIIRVGRFLPGDHMSYAGAYVLRIIGDEYVSHMMVRHDDAPGPVTWTFRTGRYSRDHARAVAILNER